MDRAQDTRIAPGKVIIDGMVVLTAAPCTKGAMVTITAVFGTGKSAKKGTALITVL